MDHPGRVGIRQDAGDAVDSGHGMIGIVFQLPASQSEAVVLIGDAVEQSVAAAGDVLHI